MSTSGSRSLVGAQGPAGAKGDPGGWTWSNIDIATDLNTITTAGMYATVGGNVDTVRNYPVTYNSPFILQVYAGSSNSGRQVAQFTFSTRANVVEYTRTWTNAGATWTAWRPVGSTRVDQTAGRAIYQWDDLNAREQRIYGDTGWRDVTADLAGGAAASMFMIRRLNDQIFLRIGALQLPTADPNAVFYTPPAGFIPDLHYDTIREDINTGAPFTVAFSSSVFVRMSYGINPNSTTHRFTGSLCGFTASAWPTTLPGTAIGSIPNT